MCRTAQRKYLSKRLKGEIYELEWLYPIKGTYSEDKNETSIFLQLTFGQFSMLMTGDVGFEGETELLNRKSLKNIDVWKVSHHGSKYSGGDEFLKVIRPQASLISVGRNSYGHPSKELTDRLKRLGSQVENTLESGALRLESDGHSFWLSLQRGED